MSTSLKQNKHKWNHTKSPHDQLAEYQWQTENVRAIKEKKIHHIQEEIISKKKSQRELENVLKQLNIHHIKFCGIKLKQSLEGN